MRYDFDEVIDRHGSNSVKWDICKDPEVIPMWVADMDFKAAPFILDAVRKRVDHGIFGYTYPSASYYQATIDWFAKRRGWKIEKDWITYISGIVPALSVAIAALTEEDEKVIFQGPAYNCFYSCVRNNGRTLLENKLIYDDAAEAPSFSIDFEDLERKCADPKATLFILCNPHNPSGRIWTREELTRMGEICLKHGVTVVSDEIHCELEMPGYTYTPFASICQEFEDNCVTFVSPSKSFNIAGLEIANIISNDPVKRQKFDKVINTWEHCDVNQIGVVALEAAYTPEGEEWISQLTGYIHENWKVLAEALRSVPEVKLCKLEGTYLTWLDCKALTAKGITTKEAQDSLIRNEKVWINSGTMYGDGDFMRINLACPRSLMSDGASRIAAGLRRLLDQ